MIAWSGKTSLIAHDSRLDVLPRTQSCMNELPNFKALIDLLLLAAFSKHGGDPYKHSRALIELWTDSCMWLYSSMVLSDLQ